MEKDNVVKEKKSSNRYGLKIAIIIFIIIIVIAGAGVGGYFAYKYYSENKSTGAEWGDIYYNYIKESDESNFLNQEEDVKIGFIQSDTNEKPLMFAAQTKNNEDNQSFENVLLYKINDNNEVVLIENIGSIFADVEFLYDVPNEKYNYFIHTDNNVADRYISIDTVIRDSEKEEEISNKIQEEKGGEALTIDDNIRVTEELLEYEKNDTTRSEYTISKEEEKVEQDTLSGDVISYDKKDEYIIDTGVEEKTFDYSEDMDIADLRNNIEIAVVEYKTTEELTADEIKTIVEEKVQATETVKQQIEEAKAEIKEEEERKAAEEELQKGLQVGSYRLKYGTYKTDASQMGNYYGTLELKPNGVFHINSNCDVNYEPIDCDGTYEVTKVQDSYDYFDGLKFTTNTGKTFSFKAIKASDGSTCLGDQWHRYIYQGN